ncbi:MAG: hypothetical protein U0Q18_15140 [Bryobacteraceae bacterium]
MSRSVLIAILFAYALAAQPERRRIGEIEFYGSAGVDVNAVRGALPVHEGEEIALDDADALIVKLQGAAGTSHVNMVCCDDAGRLEIYIGLAGKSARDVPYRPVPEGTIRLPKLVIDLHRQFTDALQKAVIKGDAAEDDSKGYALFANPEVRKAQAALRDYALRHEGLVRRVLESSSDSDHRAIAAQLMGYVRPSRGQINALARASQDSSDEVRNNATRALGVIARSDPRRAAGIPMTGLIEMMYSKTWTDRNKVAALLDAITQGGDPKVIGEVCGKAREPLEEMARWRSPGHAYSAKSILARCGTSH